MRKRWMQMVLAGMLVLTLAACGGEADDDDDDDAEVGVPAQEEGEDADDD